LVTRQRLAVATVIALCAPISQFVCGIMVSKTSGFLRLSGSFGILDSSAWAKPILGRPFAMTTKR